MAPGKDCHPFEALLCFFLEVDKNPSSTFLMMRSSPQGKLGKGSEGPTLVLHALSNIRPIKSAENESNLLQKNFFFNRYFN